MSRRSCGSAAGAGVGVGVGGLYFAIPCVSAAAMPGETERVTPSESAGCAGANSLGLWARTMLDASLVPAPEAGELSAPGTAAADGEVAALWAEAAPRPP